MRRTTTYLMRIGQVIPIIFFSFSIWATLLPTLSYFHEVGHGLAAWVLGVRIKEITSAYIVTEEVVNPLTFGIIGVAGGFYEGLLPMLGFFVVEVITKRPLFGFVKKYRFFLSILISLELALLTHGAYGFANGILEGIFNEFYRINSSNQLLWLSMFLLFALFLSFWLHKRWRTTWTLSRWKLSQ